MEGEPGCIRISRSRRTESAELFHPAWTERYCEQLGLLSWSQCKSRFRSGKTRNFANIGCVDGVHRSNSQRHPRERPVVHCRERLGYDELQRIAPGASRESRLCIVIVRLVVVQRPEDGKNRSTCAMEC